METVYTDLGINTGALGCSKLEVSPAPITMDDVGGPEAMYFSSHPKRPWVKGYINGSCSHVTLMYGLLPGVTSEHVRTALEVGKWTSPDCVIVKDVEVFPSPVPEEDPYKCIVATLELDHLKRANDALAALPHITRFPVFKAHVTLAYVKQEMCTQGMLACLRAKLKGITLPVTGCVFAPAGTKI